MTAIIAPETAADTPQNSAPADAPAPATNGRVEALWAALTANPGGTTVTIGAAAGMSRAAASKILNQLEAEGRATRIPGGHDGRGRTPDRWHPVTDTPTLHDDFPADSAQDAPAESDPDHAAGDETASASEPTGDTEPEATGEPGPDNDGPDNDGPDVPAEPIIPVGDTEPSLEEDGPDMAEEPTLLPYDDAPVDPVQDTSPEADPGDSDTPAEDEPGMDSEPTGDVPPEPEAIGEPGPQTPEEGHPDSMEEEPVQPEDPARAQVRAELLELADLILGTVTAMEGDDSILALGRLEMFAAKSTQVHRTARAVLTGAAPARTAADRASSRSSSEGTAVRPGQLRDRVLDHLAEHPGRDFTPYEIGRVLGSSSGAVANALDRLVSLGQAELTCERPRRFALATNPAPGN
jgi:DNA-binding MarR family transcriptional regulator